jgi:hypothetical protein
LSPHQAATGTGLPIFRHERRTNFYRTPSMITEARYHQGYLASAESMLAHIDAGLYNAPEQLADRPQLPPPEHPSWPYS